MTRFSQQIGQTLVAVALTSLLMFSLAENSHATIVGAQSSGDQLDGGRIKVTYSDQSVQAATITVGGPGQGIASVLNFFSFSVTGDTFFADWTLRNDTTSLDIEIVEFDLTGTMSQDPNGVIYSPGVLFDDNSQPSTANGFAGRKGAVQVNAGSPIILSSFEVTPWADAMNLGDEWVGEIIEYEDFRPQLTSVWRDDTDIVGTDTGAELPEPSSAVLMMIATVAAGCLNRRRR